MVLLLAGCGSEVGVSVPTASGSSSVCQQLAWPAQLGELAARPTDPADRAVAAWGDPPVIARCGLAALTPTTLECLEVNGVDWVIRRLDDGAAFATYGTDPAIEVLVPSTYAPEPMLLTDFTEVAASLPSNGHACISRAG